MADTVEEVCPALASDPVSVPELAPVPEEFSPIILEPLVSEVPEPVTAAVAVEAEAVSVSPDAEPEPEAAPRPRPRSKRKVIAFPKLATGSELMNRLADPVLPEQPRILDVPVELEAYPATPFLDGLQFGPDPQQQAALQADHVDLPFQPATLARRACAALLDCALVAVATMLFAAAGYKLLPKLVITKPLMVTAAVVPVLLWAFYQYLLTTYAGATAGMLATKTRLSTLQRQVAENQRSPEAGAGPVLLGRFAHDGIAVGAGGRGWALLARPHQPDVPDEPRIAVFLRAFVPYCVALQ